MLRKPGHRLLDISIAEACFGCERARELAALVREWQLSQVIVRLCDLGDPDTDRPDNVFAVPTYLLDGRVMSLGNPDVSRLYHLLTSEPTGERVENPSGGVPSSLRTLVHDGFAVITF